MNLPQESQKVKQNPNVVPLTLVASVPDESRPAQGRNVDGVDGAPAPAIVYGLDRSLRVRQPGDDDGPWAPDRGEDDPFEGVGSQGTMVLDSPGLSYPDSYAWNGGVEFEGAKSEEKSGEGETPESQYLREFNRAKACGKSAAVMSTDDFEDFMHRLDCRKAWCPVCGGKGGKVHKARVKAVRRRVKLDQVNLRHLVLTVPEADRGRFHSYKGLNQLVAAGNRTVKKHFGKDVGMVCSVHLFGDRDLGKWNPHLDIIITAEKGVRLKLSAGALADLKDTWRRALTGMGCRNVSENVFYGFRTTMVHKGHCVKYSVRPTWNGETLDEVGEDEKRFLVLDLKGFQYQRYWGTLSNVRYRESLGQTITEALEEAEGLIGKKLHFRAVVPFDADLLLKQGVIEKVGEGFYRILKKQEKRRQEAINRPVGPQARNG